MKPSTVIHDAAEIKEVLLCKYGSKDAVLTILFIYTYEGSEHGTTFLTVKLAAIYLNKSLDLDMTAPGQS